MPVLGFGLHVDKHLNKTTFTFYAQIRILPEDKRKRQKFPSTEMLKGEAFSILKNANLLGTHLDNQDMTTQLSSSRCVSFDLYARQRLFNDHR